MLKPQLVEVYVVGVDVPIGVGRDVGFAVGGIVGFSVGLLVGDAVGFSVGLLVGDTVLFSSTTTAFCIDATNGTPNKILPSSMFINESDTLDSVSASAWSIAIRSSLISSSVMSLARGELTLRIMEPMLFDDCSKDLRRPFAEFNDVPSLLTMQPVIRVRS